MTRGILVQWMQIQRKLAGISDHVLEPHKSGAWIPNTDVYENDDAIIIKVELAGIDKDSLQVRTESQAIIIEGVRREPYGRESLAGYRFRQMEIEYGPFHRTIPVPFPVDTAKAQTSIQNGILKISLPRSKESRPIKIPITMDS